MPVHAPGPRLLSSIPFKHLGGGGGGGRKESNVSLNVVPFVDMMTILVTFLLMSFSATGEIVMAQRGVELPSATNKATLKRAPIIVVSADSISFEGEGMADPRTIEADTSMEWKIVELYERLRKEHTEFVLNFDQLSDSEKKYCRSGTPPKDPAETCLKGLLILQADKGTSAKVINRVLKTAYAADYKNIMFAINSRGQ